MRNDEILRFANIKGLNDTLYTLKPRSGAAFLCLSLDHENGIIKFGFLCTGRRRKGVLSGHC